MISAVCSPNDDFGAFLCFLKLSITSFFQSCVGCLIYGLLSHNVYAEITTKPLAQVTQEITLCGNETLPANMFCCENNQIINGTYVCNKRADCHDGSDETPSACNKCGQFNLYACSDNIQCITKDFVCDSVYDCSDQSDENILGCGCPDKEDPCPNEPICISEGQWCNGINNCKSGFDEHPENCREAYSSDPTRFRFICNESTQCLIQLSRVFCHNHAERLAGDIIPILRSTGMGLADCDKATSAGGRKGFVPSTIQCINSGLIKNVNSSVVSENYRCNPNRQPFPSKNITTFYCPSRYGNDTQFCFDKDSICDRREDCSNGLDEISAVCPLKCQPGELYCSHGSCWKPETACRKRFCGYTEYPLFCTNFKLNNILRTICPEDSDENCKSDFKKLLCQKVTTLIDSNNGTNTFSTTTTDEQVQPSTCARQHFPPPSYQCPRNCPACNCMTMDIVCPKAPDCNCPKCPDIPDHLIGSNSNSSALHAAEINCWVQSTVTPLIAIVVVELICYIVLFRPWFQQLNKVKGNTIPMTDLLISEEEN